MYTSFSRPHLDYGDTNFYQPNNESLNKKIEIIHNNAALAITGVIKGTFQSRLYHELGHKSFKVYKNAFLILFHKPVIYIILVLQRMLQHIQ